jgi:LppP/LprE lipoprotein
MYRRVVCLLGLAVLLLGGVRAPATVEAADCTFVLGFAALHQELPEVVGDCLVSEHHNATNGDALQETAHGVMVWRKADNVSAFTDGYQTWVDGPSGLQQRLNTDRFAWESDYLENGAAQAVAASGFTVADPSTFHADAALQVLIGVATGSADGFNQRAFFFHNGQLVGADSTNASASVSVYDQTGNLVRLVYAIYRPTDPMCCPTGIATVARFRLDDSGFVSLDQVPPADPTTPLSRR